MMAEAARERVKKSEEDAKKRMKEVERQVKEADDRDEEMFKNMKTEYKSMMDEKYKTIQSDLSLQFDKRISSVGDNFSEHHSVNRSDQKMSILKANKVIREVSRGLGANWRPVFRILMKSIPLDTVGQTMDRIERHKPFIQAFRALNTWREIKGEEANIYDLVGALKELQLKDLHHLALEILEMSAEDSLMKITYGQGIASGSYGDNGETDGKEHTNGFSVEAQISGALQDRNLLHIARRLGGDWQQLAQALNVSEEDIANAGQVEGDPQQAAFQMLWSWRDDMVKCDQANPASILVEALKSCGKDELATEYEEKIKS